MPISQELADFRIDNSCDTSQMSDAVGLRWYNDSRDILIDRITKEKEDFFYNEIKAELVSGQREYTIPKRGDLDGDGNPMDGVKKIKGLSVKLKSTDTNYKKLDLEVLENLSEDLLQYENGTRHFYITSDNSNFIYPTPTENITDGLIMYAIVQPQKLTLSSEETLGDDIKKCILLGVAERFFTSQKLYDFAQLASNKFTAECNRVAISLSSRNQGPKTIKLPSLSHLR